MTQCKDEFRNLSGCVPEILTVSRINIFFFENTMRKLRSIAFQPCISWGGQYFWNGSNKWFYPKSRPENTNFCGHFSWSPDFGGLWDLKTWNFVTFDIIPKKYWLKRALEPNELQWRQRRQKCSIWRHHTFFLRTDTQKRKTNVFFLYFP